MAGVASSNDTQSATSGFVPTLSSSRPVESRATASSTPPLGEPARIYQERLESRRRELLDCDRRVEMIANARLLLFVLGLVALIAAASTSFVPWWSLIPLALGFTVLVLLNGRLDRLAERARRAVAFHERGLARLEDRWTGTGPTGERYLDAAADHPYAADLDLFGNGSVFQWLCVARTRVGEQTLADWLLHPAPREVVIARQQAVAELAERLEFREDLALLGSDVRTGIEPGTLIRWAVEEPRLTQSWAPPLAALSSLATLVTLLAWMVGITGPSPFLTMALGLILFHRAFRARIAPAVESIETHARELELLAELLGRFEAETFQAPHLVTLQGKTEGRRPSALGTDRPAQSIGQSVRQHAQRPVRPIRWSADVAAPIRFSDRCLAARVRSEGGRVASRPRGTGSVGLAGHRTVRESRRSVPRIGGSLSRTSLSR